VIVIMLPVFDYDDDNDNDWIRRAADFGSTTE